MFPGLAGMCVRRKPLQAGVGSTRRQLSAPLTPVLRLLDGGDLGLGAHVIPERSTWPAPQRYAHCTPFSPITAFATSWERVRTHTHTHIPWLSCLPPRAHW